MYRLVFSLLFSVAAMFGIARAMLGYVQSSGDRTAPAATKTQAPAADIDETVIRRDQTGQFYLEAEANGHDTRFLIDTGADFVAVSVAEAEKLDLDFDPANFEPITKTASGVGMGQKVTIARLSLGNHEFENVDAVVVEGLETNLLGQSILSRLGAIELRGDELIIRHAA